MQSIAKLYVEKNPTDTVLKLLSEGKERYRRHEMQMLQLLIQNQNRPAFSPYTQMLSVTPPTKNYQHGSSVTSQVTFPAARTLSSGDISQHQMPATSRNDLEYQIETQVALKVTGHLGFVSHIDWSNWLWPDNMDFAKFCLLYQTNLNQLLNLLFP